MSAVRVKSLSAEGTRIFSEWLKKPEGDPPTHILVDLNYCEEFPEEHFVDTDRVFETSFEFGKYLHEEVFVKATNPAVLVEANGMWAWISLAFIQSLLSKTSARKNKPLDLPHYIELPDQHGRRLGYRLIARTAWRLVKLHGALAQVALGSKRSPWGEMAEQMTSRQEIFAHRGFWEVAFRLYLNTKKELRRGATSQRPASARKDPKNKIGMGGVRRLPSTFRQFDRTYLTRIMSLDQMLPLLPSEYHKWLA